MSEIRFGAWLPDGQDYKNPGLEVAKNVIPGPEGYQPALGLDAANGDVGATVLSARGFERKDGTRVTVAATAGDLHTVINGTVVDSSLSLSLTEPVSFEQFGTTIYATCKAGTWYLDDIESDTAFVAAGWTIPDGKVVARVSDFLMMGDLTDTDASDAVYRVRWSPYNNPQGEWETSISLQSDAVDLKSQYGPVMAIAGGTYGLIFQKNAISRISYTGGTSVFAKVEVDIERGCAASQSIAQVGDSVYFLSHDGFRVTDGGASRSISRGRVWKWFLAEADTTYLNRTIAAVDWSNRCVIWTIPGPSGAFVGLIYFNWETESWSHVDLSCDWIFSSGRDGVTLETLAATYTDLDAMTVSLDSEIFRARGRSVAVFDGGLLSQLSGDTLAAEFETGDFQVLEGRRGFVSEVTPLITNADETTEVSLAGKEKTDAITTYSASSTVGPIGFAPFNFDARYLRVKLVIPAATLWSDAYGLQIMAQTSGRT